MTVNESISKVYTTVRTVLDFIPVVRTWCLSVSVWLCACVLVTAMCFVFQLHVNERDLKIQDSRSRDNLIREISHVVYCTFITIT